MKIAFAAAACSPHTVKWVNALAAAGHEIVLYTMTNHEQLHGEINEAVQTQYLPYTEAQNGVKKNASALRDALSGGSFNAVVAMDLSTYGFMAAKAKANNVLMVSSGLDVYNAAKTGSKSAVVKSIKHGAAIAATAPNVITKIKELFKKDKPYFVTPFGVDMEKFSKKDVERGSEVCFGSLKFLEHHNSVDLVLEAFSKFLARAEIPTKLKVVGSGSMTDALKQKAQSMGIADKVEFTGYVKNEDMPNVINTIDVVVQMTPEECFGVSGVEAMACEVPMVASDTYGASEYVLNSVTGYLVKAGNTDACCDRMIDLAKNEGGRKKMGESCREDVLPLYNLPDCVKKFEEALRAAAGRTI
ncbi:glycosyltransferase family 4 protein [Christensenellaceae bacterium OttesenSCG-928-K19]|nr:glycosyltransferase family 4 protein [Christensenellaceae bacterium OttesenSCG-928-K19]